MCWWRKGPDPSMRCGCRALVLLPWVLLALVLLPWVLLALEAQLVCWQALLRCHEEPECSLAYSQHLAACGGALGGGRQCPSHCINTLIRLNHTRSGPGLEACDCAQDLQCLSAKRAIEPCLPRRLPSHAGGMGCMEARQRCEEDSRCRASLAAYLASCGQLFNGRRCPSRCRATIQQMLLLPAGVLLQRCVCDGVERPFCEVVKDNMRRLCFTGELVLIPEQPDEDDVYEDEDEDPQRDREEGDTRPSPAPHPSASGLMLLLPPLWML